MSKTYFSAMHFPYSILVILSLVSSVAFSQNIAKENRKIDYKAKYEQALADYNEFERAHGHYIQTPNVYMHYSTWGDSTDTPLVWIHGSFQNTTELLGIVDSLVSASLYVIAIDYYGHGLTPIPEDKEVSIYHVADDINHLLDFMNIDKAIIGGWSRGGTIATAFYDAYPKKVMALILEDGGSANALAPRQKLPREEVVERYTTMHEHFKDTTFSTQFEAYRHFHNDKDSSSQLRLLSSIKSDINNQWSWNIGLAEWLEESTLEQSLTAALRPTLSGLFTRSSILQQPLVVYRNLNVPILIFDPIGDDAEQFFDLREQNAKLQSLHPDLVIHLIYEDTYHALHYQRPDRFTQDVLSFINGLVKPNKRKKE